MKLMLLPRNEDVPKLFKINTLEFRLYLWNKSLLHPNIFYASNNENSCAFYNSTDITYSFFCNKIFHSRICLLYTSDAADERSSVDLGGRRIIKKKEKQKKKKKRHHIK